MEIVSKEGLLFVLRWLHIFFGVVWIGLLYYFNFVQGSFMKEASAAAKPDVTTKLLPRALWWFRWGAMWTMATGLTLLGMLTHDLGGFNSAWGVKIWAGAIFGLTMWFNVWFIIWPNQKIVIKNAEDTAAGKPANPAAAGAAAKALLASRTNTFLSIPLLFYMAGARHLPLVVDENSNFGAYWIALGIVWLLIEGNAIKGKLGPLETVKGVVTSGFVLSAVIYLFQSILL